MLIWPFLYNNRSTNPSLAGYFEGLPMIAFLVFLYGVPLAALVEILFALPFWLISKHHNLRSVWAFIAAGALSSFIFFCGLEFYATSPAVFDLYSGVKISSIFFNEATPLFILGGAISGLVFRQILFWKVR